MSLSMAQALVLAIVQGMTEWLPVSSSGHLALAYMAMGVEPPLMFNLMVHMGTLGAVVWVFRTELAHILRALPRMFKHVVSLNVPPERDGHARMAFILIVATIPAAVAGYFLKDYAERAFTSIPMLSAAFIFTGIVLFSTRKIHVQNEQNNPPQNRKDVSMDDSIKIGVAQILTIFPGVSRSGMTISAGMHSGLARMEAAKFSFLLSIPLILGSTIYEAYSTHTTTLSPDILPQMLLGAIASFIVGIITLRFLINIIRRGRFHLFAPYCIILGTTLIIWSML